MCAAGCDRYNHMKIRSEAGWLTTKFAIKTMYCGYKQCSKSASNHDMRGSLSAFIRLPSSSEFENIINNLISN